MKRVLIYSTAYYPLVGGAEVAIAELAERCADYEFEVITARIRPNLVRHEMIGPVLVHRLGFGCRFDKILLVLIGGWYGRTLHQKKSFDLVWGMMASFGGFAASDFKKYLPEVPYLLTLQEGDELSEIEYKVRWFRKKFVNIFRRADYIQAISNYLADWAKSLGAKCPVEIVPNGVDLQKFKIESTNSDTKEKVIVSASRLVKKNGITDLILALKFLPSNIKLKLLGEGGERQNLQSLVEKNGLVDRVDFVGFVPAEELAKYYSQADIFSRPSYSEGLGNAFLEAMACGLPVIGTTVGGIKDFLIDGETGFVCEVGSPESIATKVSFIIDPQNSLKVQEVIKNAQTMVREKYDWDKIAKRMIEIFETLIKAKQK